LRNIGTLELEIMEMPVRSLLVTNLDPTCDLIEEAQDLKIIFSQEGVKVMHVRVCKKNGRMFAFVE